MMKEYNWRIADWTDPEDFSVDEPVEVVADEPKEERLSFRQYLENNKELN